MGITCYGLGTNDGSTGYEHSRLRDRLTLWSDLHVGSRSLLIRFGPAAMTLAFAKLL
jgi:hypothetical protein